MAENGAHFSGEGHLIEGQIEGDSNKTIRPIVCDEDGHLIIDLDASTITIGTVQIEDSDGDPLTSTSGSLDVNITNTVPVTGTFSFSNALTATTTAIVVTTAPTPLLVTNVLRKGFAIQNQDIVCFVKLDSTATTSLYSYELPRKGILENDIYNGPVTAVTASGSVTVMVTELV